MMPAFIIQTVWKLVWTVFGFDTPLWFLIFVCEAILFWELIHPLSANRGGAKIWGWKEVPASAMLLGSSPCAIYIIISVVGLSAFAPDLAWDGQCLGVSIAISPAVVHSLAGLLLLGGIVHQPREKKVALVAAWVYLLVTGLFAHGIIQKPPAIQTALRAFATGAEIEWNRIQGVDIVGIHFSPAVLHTLSALTVVAVAILLPEHATQLAGFLVPLFLHLLCTGLRAHGIIQYPPDLQAAWRAFQARLDLPSVVPESHKTADAERMGAANIGAVLGGLAAAAESLFSTIGWVVVFFMSSPLLLAWVVVAVALIWGGGVGALFLYRSLVSVVRWAVYKVTERRRLQRAEQQADQCMDDLIRQEELAKATRRPADGKKKPKKGPKSSVSAAAAQQEDSDTEGSRRGVPGTAGRSADRQVEREQGGGLGVAGDNDDRGWLSVQGRGQHRSRGPSLALPSRPPEPVPSHTQTQPSRGSSRALPPPSPYPPSVPISHERLQRAPQSTNRGRRGSLPPLVEPVGQPRSSARGGVSSGVSSSSQSSLSHNTWGPLTTPSTGVTSASSSSATPSSAQSPPLTPTTSTAATTSTSNAGTGGSCIVCCDDSCRASIKFMPCKHLVVCQRCFADMKRAHEEKVAAVKRQNARRGSRRTCRCSPAHAAAR